MAAAFIGYRHVTVFVTEHWECKIVKVSYINLPVPGFINRLPVLNINMRVNDMVKATFGALIGNAVNLTAAVCVVDRSDGLLY